jgi:CubicO group peptidase (beta-lactamase class C family)
MILSLLVAQTLAVNNAVGILDSAVRNGDINAAAILVTKKGTVVLHRGFGRAKPDSVFLLASITKPVTAAALMLLVEQGKVSLNDPVKLYLPDFAGAERDKVLVRDLLTHTSGLPDMLPENIELRRAHAPLSEFVQRTYKTPLLYPPGTQFRYQSMGLLLAGQIVEKISGMHLRDYIKANIFEPLEMRNSALGLGGMRIEDTVHAWTPPDLDAVDTERFGANSPYWRDMGHPWGGMHSTTSDLAKLLTVFLNGGSYGSKRVFSRATVEAMTSDWNQGLHAPWGLGWALGRSVAWNFFGDLVSPKTFGHGGATGTVAWADPETGVVCIILTDRLVRDGSLLRRVSNAVAASVRD